MDHLSAKSGTTQTSAARTHAAGGQRPLMHVHPNDILAQDPPHFRGYGALM